MHSGYWVNYGHGQGCYYLSTARDTMEDGFMLGGGDVVRRGEAMEEELFVRFFIPHSS